MGSIFWGLAALLVAGVALSQRAARKAALPVEAAMSLLADEPDCQITDVRSPAEYASGHLVGARNLPLNQLPERWLELDSSRPVLVYCATGVRSAAARRKLLAQGLVRVYDLRGGVQTWVASGHRLE